MIIFPDYFSSFVWTYHLTAKFWTSPFLSSSNFKSIRTTLRSDSSSNFMVSFWSSLIKSLVAINRKSLSEEVIWKRKGLLVWIMLIGLIWMTSTFSRRWAIWKETPPLMMTRWFQRLLLKMEWETKQTVKLQENFGFCTATLMLEWNVGNQVDLIWFPVELN